jgi:hypothetical protein
MCRDLKTKVVILCCVVRATARLSGTVSNGGMRISKKNPKKLGQKSGPVPLSASPRHPGSNPRFRGEKPKHNRMSYGRDLGQTHYHSIMNGDESGKKLPLSISGTIATFVWWDWGKFTTPGHLVSRLGFEQSNSVTKVRSFTAWASLLGEAVLSGRILRKLRRDLIASIFWMLEI